MERERSGVDRERVAWWVVAAVLGATVLFVLHSFVGTFVLALFVYYGTRPAYRWLIRRGLPAGGAAAVTLLLLVVPAIAVVSYVVVTGIEQASTIGDAQLQAVMEALPGEESSPLELARSRAPDVAGLQGAGMAQQVLAVGLGFLAVFTNGLVHFFVALAIVFFLLRDGSRVDGWFRNAVGDADSAAYGYASAIDRDLHAVYFGNVVTVLLIAVASVVVYNAFNAVAPGGLAIPLPTFLGLLTGVASFVPIVVGKLVYVPITLLLAVDALRTDPGLLWVPAVFFGVALVVLDLFPQTVLLPYIAGRTIHVGLVMLSYILGTMLFGWYGLFLGPLVVVLVVQFVRIVFPALVHGEQLTPRVDSAPAIGSDPAVEETADGEPAPNGEETMPDDEETAAE